MQRAGFLVMLVALIAGSFPVAILAADARDPLVGTWRLNLEKSTFRGAPGPKGQLRVYEREGDQETLVSRGIGADGGASLVRYTARYDGKDYRITGSAGGDQLVLSRIDEFTTRSTQKRDGKPVIIATRTVSRDGRTLTVVSRGTTARGESIDTVLVFDRS